MNEDSLQVVLRSTSSQTWTFQELGPPLGKQERNRDLGGMAVTAGICVRGHHILVRQGPSEACHPCWDLARILFWSLEVVSSADPRTAYQVFSLESNSSLNPLSLYSLLEAGSCSALCLCGRNSVQTQAVNWMRLGRIWPHTVLSLPFLCNVPSRKYF